MKRTFLFLITLLIIAAAFAGCSSGPKADYASPEAVVDAYLEIHPFVDGTKEDLCTELAGKTVRVKINNESYFFDIIYETPSVSKKIRVNLFDKDGGLLENYDYDIGDVRVYEITDVKLKSTKDGQFRTYDINVKIPD